MQKPILLAALIGLFATTGSANTFDASLHIAYPANGATVAHYFHSSFTVSCPGRYYTVKWYLDGLPTGSSTFYDTVSVNLAHRLSPNVSHSLKVLTSCGSADTVVFNVM